MTGSKSKYCDAESGLYYYGYRYYDPITGRWRSRDPLGEYGGLNRYAILANSLLTTVDSLGLEDPYLLYPGDPLHPSPTPPPNAMPCALARSIFEQGMYRITFDYTGGQSLFFDRPFPDPTIWYRRTYDDTAWYSANRPGVVQAALEHWRQEVNSVGEALCRGFCPDLTSKKDEHFTMRGGAESQYGDPDQSLLETIAYIGDLDFMFGGFTEMSDAVNHHVKWCAEVWAVERHGAQRSQDYFKGPIQGTIGYWAFVFLTGPERLVRVGTWTICGDIDCCSSE